jgi:hypothetical protein
MDIVCMHALLAEPPPRFHILTKYENGTNYLVLSLGRGGSLGYPFVGITQIFPNTHFNTHQDNYNITAKIMTTKINALHTKSIKD